MVCGRAVRKSGVRPTPSSAATSVLGRRGSRQLTVQSSMRIPVLPTTSAARGFASWDVTRSSGHHWYSSSYDGVNWENSHRDPPGLLLQWSCGFGSLGRIRLCSGKEAETTSGNQHLAVDRVSTLAGRAGHREPRGTCSEWQPRGRHWAAFLQAAPHQYLARVALRPGRGPRRGGSKR